MPIYELFAWFTGAFLAFVALSFVTRDAELFGVSAVATVISSMVTAISYLVF